MSTTNCSGNDRLDRQALLDAGLINQAGHGAIHAALHFALQSRIDVIEAELDGMFGPDSRGVER